jgi:hypothetical protein
MKKTILVVEYCGSNPGKFASWLSHAEPKIKARFISKMDGDSIVTELVQTKNPVSFVIISPFLLLQNKPEGLDLMPFITPQLKGRPCVAVCSNDEVLTLMKEAGCTHTVCYDLVVSRESDPNSFNQKVVPVIRSLSPTTT